MQALLKSASETLARCGIENPEKEAEIIVTHAAGIDTVTLYRDDPAPGGEAEAKVRAMLDRRCRREPLQYILGSVEFRGLKIHVGPGVLIPRPETELIIEELLKFLPPPGRGLRVLDLCTGSGCLALAAAQALPGSHVAGTDISGEALAYARKNAVENGIENAVFLRGHLFEPVGGETFDAIVSNPPYVASGDMETLQPEIRDWEPGEALDGGEDGLDFYRAILAEAPRRLHEGGPVLLELGWGEAEGVAELARKSGFHVAEVVRDLCGIERVMVLRGQVRNCNR
jgi:release factor glutamine methyltransferase